ncbi:MAG: NAD-dependent epimerase/dehydratase family protein [Pseudomonadota bacterium]
MAQTALILGASGRFGRHAAEAFEKAGWTVRRFRRGGDLTRAAMGCDVIVNAWNPPYPDWFREVPAYTPKVIEAARASGATVIVPGNVYVFGEGSPECLGPETPHAAQNPLGRVRVEMEAAYRRSGVQTIILRGGDFLDTNASGNWLDQMVKKIDTGVLIYPGDTGASHAWAFLPDMARAAVALAEIRHQLEVFEDIPFPGYTLTATELVAAIGDVLDRPVRIRRFPWLLLRLIRPFWRMATGLLEMSYLWRMPHRLDGTRMAELLPDFRPAPLGEAIFETLKPHVDPNKTVPRSEAHSGGKVRGIA